MKDLDFETVFLYAGLGLCGVFALGFLFGKGPFKESHKILQNMRQQ